MVDIPALDYPTFQYVVSKRLLREKGIDNEEIGKYIAERVHEDFGHKTNMRLAIKIARLANSHALSTSKTVSKDTVNIVVAWLKHSTVQ